MKNIIFITNYFGHGGAATVMKSIIEKLPSNRYKIKLISFINDENIYEIPKNVEYITLDIQRKENFLIKIKKIFKLRKILKKYKNSIIISFEYFINMRAIISNLIINNKIIVSERNDPSRSGNNKKLLRNFLYRFCDILVCQTNDAKEYFPKYIRKKTVVIPNPVKNNLPDRYEGKRKNRIVTFCRIEKQKNLPMMLNAFKKVLEVFPEYTLEIYGDGSQKESIKLYAKEIGIDNKVIFFDFIKDIHLKIYDATMFVSTSDFEGISNSMMEALAIGLPTICTDCPCGGARMIIKDGVNGMLSPVGDEEEFAKKMIKLIKNDKMRDNFSLNAIKIKDDYSSNKIQKEWINLIEK